MSEQVSLVPTFLVQKSRSLAKLLILFRKKARSARLFVCKTHLRTPHCCDHLFAMKAPSAYKYLKGSSSPKEQSKLCSVFYAKKSYIFSFTCTYFRRLHCFINNLIVCGLRYAALCLKFNFAGDCLKSLNIFMIV